jgi:hypothetical protein
VSARPTAGIRGALLPKGLRPGDHLPDLLRSAYRHQLHFWVAVRVNTENLVREGLADRLHVLEIKEHGLETIDPGKEPL